MSAPIGTNWRYGWLNDRYGVFPDSRVEGILRHDGSGPDPEKSARAMRALLGMKKLDIAALKRAHEGG